MPVWLIPLAIKGAAAVAGLVGVGSAVQGASKMKEANDHLKEAQSRYESNTKKFEQKNKYATLTMDKLGKLELEILASFDDFSDTFEQIQNRPKFEKYSKDKVTIPEYNGEDIKEVSVGAGVLLGGLGGGRLRRSRRICSSRSYYSSSDGSRYSINRDSYCITNRSGSN